MIISARCFSRGKLYPILTGPAAVRDDRAGVPRNVTPAAHAMIGFFKYCHDRPCKK
jgi:hypothetical protein